MVKYAATKAVTIYDTVENAITGIATAIHLVDTGTFNNFKCGVDRIEANKYAGWYVYTNAA
jgi:hypothetical protein